MYRSAKEQYALLPEQQWIGSPAEAAVLQSAELGDSSVTAAYTSVSEQLKRTPRKPAR